MNREPLFNVPAVIVATLAVLAAIHGVRTLLLSEDQDIQILLYFAFIPARYDASGVLGSLLPGGIGADIWTFVTYSLLHGSWTHLIVNAVWLLAFGSALARRFGASRFLAFFAVTAAAGAAMHLLTNTGSHAPMIGASASISGAMAAAMRFVFQRGGPLGALGMPCVVFGPGDIAQAPTKDEWIELDQVRQAAEADDQIARDLG